MRPVPPWTTALVHMTLVLACVATLYPVMWVIKQALMPSDALSLSANPIPTEVTFQNFTDVMSTTDSQGRWLFGRQFMASIAVSVGSTLVGLLLALTTAYAMSRFRFTGREVGLQALITTQMFPSMLMLVPLYALLRIMGLLDTWTGLIVVYSTTSLPFCVWMLKSYFDSIPKELEEAAVLDGATPFQVFVRVVLPLARPAIAITALYSFMSAWNEFILAATLINDAARFTLPVALKRYIGEYTVDLRHFAAGAVIISVPVMALFFALQKHLVGGLTSGGVKG